MTMQVGHEIDREGNIGNDTRRIEDMQLRFIVLMTVINSTVDNLEVKQRLSKHAVNTYHKESGTPIPELVSLIKRMTEEVKEICNYLEKNTEEMRGFFR